jgi:hypothetical protein
MPTQFRKALGAVIGLLAIFVSETQAQNAEQTTAKITEIEISPFGNGQYIIQVSGKLTLGKKDKYIGRTFTVKHQNQFYPVTIIKSNDPRPGTTEPFSVNFIVPSGGDGHFTVEMDYIDHQKFYPGSVTRLPISCRKTSS